jgi:cell wall-associated NlpC family hydrolase
VPEARAILKQLNKAAGGGRQKGLKRAGGKGVGKVAKMSSDPTAILKTVTQPKPPTEGLKLAALDFIQNRDDPNALLQFAQTKKEYESAAQPQTTSKVLDTLNQGKKVKPITVQKNGRVVDVSKVAPGSGGKQLVRWANATEGTREGGIRHIRWAKAAGISASAPWCAAWVAYGIRKQGLAPPSNPAYTGSWLSWSGGKKINYKQAQPGDLLIFDWGDGGITDHIGVYKGNGQMTAGNDSNNSVGSSSVPTSNIVGVVRPKWKKRGRR